MSREPVPGVPVEPAICLVRGVRVMLDRDLAALYGVEVRVLNQAVTRNLARFPPDFVFRPTQSELADLRSQNVISSGGWGGRRNAPYAFTEQGVAMLSGVLRSPRAIQVNIEIMRAFVRLRRGALLHADLARKLAALEKKYDSRFRIVFEAIVEGRSAEPRHHAVRPKGRRRDDRTADGPTRPTPAEDRVPLREVPTLAHPHETP